MPLGRSLPVAFAPKQADGVGPFPRIDDFRFVQGRPPRSFSVVQPFFLVRKRSQTISEKQPVKVKEKHKHSSIFLAVNVVQ